jgi:hypothetical protein
VTQFVRRALPEAVVQAIQGFDPDAFRAKLHKEFDEFIGRGGIVRLSLDSVSPETVFEKYFSQSGTFGAADKKAEFPDAFSLAALEAWCHTNKAKVYAVSGDEDWKRGCDGHATVLHVERLEKVLELFSDSIVVHAIKAAVFDMNEELTSLIEAKVETIDIYFADEDTTPNAEIVGVTMEGEEFHYPNVVEIGDTTAVLVLDYTYNLMIDVVCDDITSKLDLAKYRFEKCLSGTIYRSLETDITIQVAFSRDKPEELRFLSVELSNDILPIEIEEGELGPEEPSR